ncbi:hypothetical protein Q4534_19960 [Cyclobacterium sp. 1_MG-2023]|uniref:toxin-antitoxin system YwqK family antitoxin n=1 Tax=Cyclobacterium sp. 1_MG-2023 TaxID=3062681 RepID=UPI0026E18EA1|nr:hypothetical protein [Cyclobacterium sp. 1_MG-2023]MDO6439712.1 hypothetical protein [Cyclobacterium sp. 1_MG-2023]
MGNYSSDIIKTILVMLCCIGVIACKNTGEELSFDGELNYEIDTSGIPRDTIDFNAPGLTYKNGYYYLSGEKYSGIVHKKQIGFNIVTYSSVYQGMLHGSYSSYYPSGELFETRRYRNNLSIGKQLGYWEETGSLKFEYNYYNDKKEGEQKSWYADGSLAYTYHYKDDKQEGLQQAWRQNGSLYRNFEVQNGTRYGLQKTTTCYELEDEKLK